MSWSIKTSVNHTFKFFQMPYNTYMRSLWGPMSCDLNYFLNSILIWSSMLLHHLHKWHPPPFISSICTVVFLSGNKSAFFIFNIKIFKFHNTHELYWISDRQISYISECVCIYIKFQLCANLKSHSSATYWKKNYKLFFQPNKYKFKNYYPILVWILLY